MGLLDALVNRSFRETPAGRAVVFSGDPRKRAYLVGSPAEEQKIRSFLKMFYFAHLSILVLGIMLSQAWASWFVGLYDRPAHHLLGCALIAMAIYCLVVVLPYALLWRAYQRALPSFAGAPANEVSLTGIKAPGRQRIWLAVVGFALLILVAILLLAARPGIP